VTQGTGPGVYRQGNVIEDASAVGLQSDRQCRARSRHGVRGRKYGKLSLEKVIAPAAAGEDGFALTAQDVKNLRDDKHLAQFPESRRIFQRDGNYYKAAKSSSSRTWRAL